MPNGSNRKPSRAMAWTEAGGVNVLPTTRSGRSASTSSTEPETALNRRAVARSIELASTSWL